MIDLLYLLEFTWIVLWIGIQSAQRALLYTTGIFTAGLVSAAISTWLTHLFAPPSSHVFQWLESHLSSDTHSVILNSLIPPETAGLTSTTHLQWVAYSLLKTFLFIGLTLSIFLSFVIVGHLVTALWDGHSTSTPTGNWHIIKVGLGLLSGAYLTLLSVLALGNLAWIRDLSGLQTELSPSVVMHLTALALGWLKLHAYV